MSDRIAVTVMVDPDVWRESKNKLSVTRSDFINEQLCIAIDAADDEETVLRNEIIDLQNEINVKESRLCKLRAERLENERKECMFDEVMVTVDRIIDRNGFIGKDQLRNISKQRDVAYNSLLNHVLDLGYDVQKNHFFICFKNICHLYFINVNRLIMSIILYIISTKIYKCKKNFIKYKIYFNLIKRLIIYEI